jgi:hypothetical protein
MLSDHDGVEELGESGEWLQVCRMALSAFNATRVTPVKFDRLRSR